MKELSNEARKEVFEQCGVPYGKRKSTHNIHHDYHKRDKRNNLLPKGFDVNSRTNLTVLPIMVHNELHKLIDSTPEYRNNIGLRVYFSNMAYIGELDLIPERMYRTII